MNLPDHIILCRDIRRFIIENGSATTEEVLEKFPGSQGCLKRMSLNRTIKKFLREDRTLAWKPTPILPLRSRDVPADLSFERDD